MNFSFSCASQMFPPTQSRSLAITLCRYGTCILFIRLVLVIFLMDVFHYLPPICVGKSLYLHRYYVSGAHSFTILLYAQCSLWLYLSHSVIYIFYYFTHMCTCRYLLVLVMYITFYPEKLPFLSGPLASSRLDILLDLSTVSLLKVRSPIFMQYGRYTTQFCVCDNPGSGYFSIFQDSLLLYN